MAQSIERLRAVWRQTDDLFCLLKPSDWSERSIELRHPFLFYVGHLPAFAWHHLASQPLGLGAVHPGYDILFARGIDPASAADAARSSPAAWPSVAETEAYRNQVRGALERVFEEHPVDASRVSMVVEHELMHHETLLYMFARAPLERLEAGAEWKERARPMRFASNTGWATFAGGDVVLGAEEDSGVFGWDNEFPTQRLPVAPFRMTCGPVTIDAFRAFVCDGGYREPGWWADEDFDWISSNGHAHPVRWSGADDGDVVRTPFENVSLAAAGGLAVQVSNAEARAYCRWAGTRLPTEAELHFAMRNTAADGNPCVGLGKDGWEWSATPFLPRPGFRPLHPGYEGYSADFFDGRHFVVVGSSWATAPQLRRPSFCNWYQRHYPYVFSKFRQAVPAG